MRGDRWLAASASRDPKAKVYPGREWETTFTKVKDFFKKNQQKELNHDREKRRVVKADEKAV